MPPDVSQSGSTQERVDNRVDKHISVGMPLLALGGRYLYAAEDKFSPRF
jgi:hypothetical protein